MYGYIFLLPLPLLLLLLLLSPFVELNNPPAWLKYPIAISNYLTLILSTPLASNKLYIMYLSKLFDFSYYS